MHKSLHRGVVFIYLRRYIIFSRRPLISLITIMTPSSRIIPVEAMLISNSRVNNGLLTFMLSICSKCPQSSCSLYFLIMFCGTNK